MKDNDKSHGVSSTRAYRVEARLTLGLPPTVENGMPLDGEWRPIQFAKSPIGVRSGMEFNAEADRQGFVAFDAAMALAWWFLANSSRNAVETRLVEYEFKYSWSSERKNELPPIERDVWRQMRVANQPETGNQPALEPAS